MKLLAIETTGPLASVAFVGSDGRIVESVSDRTLSHLQHLIPMTDQLLADCGSAIGDVTHIAVSEGPGSFTGIRIGMATAKALAQVLDVPVVPVPTLEALAYNCEGFSGIRCTILDARRDQIYAAAFIMETDGLRRLVPEQALRVDAFASTVAAAADRWRSETAAMAGSDAGRPSVCLLGDGIKPYGSALTALLEAAGFAVELAPEERRSQRARSVAALGAMRAARGEGMDCRRVRPVYLRKAEAERKLLEKIRFREAEARDVGKLAEMDGICFSLPWSREAFREEILENPLARYLVAELNGETIAYAGLWKILEEGHITNVAVLPAHRRRGIAEALVTELCRRAEAEGVRKFTLEVRASNAGAITLYEKLGFAAMGRRKNYYDDNGEDALLLWRG